MARKRILFVAENVTLAQVVRLRVLAAALDPERYEVCFASSAFDPMIFGGTDFAQYPIYSVSAPYMFERIARGRQPFDLPTLERYVADDLELFERVRPALVVGDLRLSLTVSAPKFGVPYAALINAYWSPYAERDRFPVPEHPLVDWFGAERVGRPARFVMPLVFRHFAQPINTLRKRYGMTRIGGMLEVLTAGDLVLYADVPELIRTTALPAHHHFLGPVLWAPRLPLPDFWQDVGRNRPLVYVTLGSSGALRVSDAVLSALRELPVDAVLSTAGRFAAGRLADNVWAADFLPGDLAARRSALVICNGGSSTGYQALYEGVPVLGLPSNMDQYLAMAAIERSGAGKALRSGTATATSVRAAVELLLHSEAHRAAAQRLAVSLRAPDAAARFVALCERATRAEPQRAQVARV